MRSKERSVACPQAKAGQAYSNHVSSTAERNKAREPQDQVQPCTKEQFLAYCYTVAIKPKFCAKPGCTQRPEGIDKSGRGHQDLHEQLPAPVR